MFNKRIKGHHVPSNKKPQMSNEQNFEAYLNSKDFDDGLGVIYFHIPFCDNICSFCAMNRTKLDGKIDDYANYLLSQIDKYSKFNYSKHKKIDSVYFGGGTPTILKENHLEQILKAIFKSFNLSSECEISFESTLHNLSDEKINVLQNEGANRLSIGIQTFNDKGRALLNRVHKRDKAIDRLSFIKQKFSGFVCTDIIYNYPDQSVDEIIDDAKILKDLKIDSTSFYSLMFNPGSELSKNIDQDYYDLQKDRLLHNTFIHEMFIDGDYEFLEYTKINRKNKDKYKYIRLSHLGADILPIGKGAGGRVGNYSIFNAGEDMKIVSISTQNDINLKKFASLFQYTKIDLNVVKSYVKQDTFNALMDFFIKCEKSNYLKINDNFLDFSIDGVFWGNTIANEVINLSIKDFE